ncbi:uncharacterized protein LACBIDRAFT_308982 [Laccaria bicolor S238N-H82]|uniref:Predicted protein n=1 Tax=Laccaria bicolor (strain S238N-H82 / ATCC MYA-4686) TaxID=486041 RepID=B0CV89_LACBS|nr:uncharacterized protein LACBIDRAFT_308982 [Laccaria bicolor S238N-H82]EDR13289.1 predicted protein [Laccaria bicolor S238N-H82]|eukprot:XP_001875787.1 predicted protein [Laccaria bicolor S238N-H82]
MTSAYQDPLQFVSASQSSSPSDPSGYLTSSSSYTTPTYFPLPTLKPLKLATASKVLDPTKQVCQYEVPGGGTCRDEECEDLHLSRLISMGGVEPSGTSCGLAPVAGVRSCGRVAFLFFLLSFPPHSSQPFLPFFSPLSSNLLVFFQIKTQLSFCAAFCQTFGSPSTMFLLPRSL